MKTRRKKYFFSKNDGLGQPLARPAYHELQLPGASHTGAKTAVPCVHVD